MDEWKKIMPAKLKQLVSSLLKCLISVNKRKGDTTVTVNCPKCFECIAVITSEISAFGL